MIAVPERVTDPVCGNVLLYTAQLASVRYKGRLWFFCSDPSTRCRAQFKAAPDAWVIVRSEAGVAYGPPALSRRPGPFSVRSGEPSPASADSEEYP